MSLALALIGIPFIRFNHYEEPHGRNHVLTEIDEYLPEIEENKATDTQTPLLHKTPNPELKIYRISEDHHKLLLRMGKGLKSAKVNQDGIIVTSDWSWYS